VRSYADWVLNLDRPRLASEILARYPPAGEVAAWHLLCGGAALRAGELDAARTHYGWLQEHEDGQLAALSRASLYLADGKPREVVRELGGGALGLDFTAQAEALGHSLLGEAHLALGEPRDAARELSHALALAETWRSGIAGDEHNVFGEWIGLHTVTLRALAERELGRDLEAARIVEDYQSRSLRSAPADGSAPASTGHAGLAGGDLTAWADRFELGLVTWAVGADFGVAAHVAPGGRPSSGGAPEDIARAVRVERGRREIRTACARRSSTGARTRPGGSRASSRTCCSRRRSARGSARSRAAGRSRGCCSWSTGRSSRCRSSSSSPRRWARASSRS
jgi:hypothetical protein